MKGGREEENKETGEGREKSTDAIPPFTFLSIL